jgi:hypothetical protein
LLLLYAIAAGLIAGWLAGGRLSALAGVRLRLWPLAVAGLLFQLALFSAPVAAQVGGLGPPLYVGSTAVVLVALLANFELPGFGLVAVGAVLNLAAIVANGGQMPASAQAMALAHGSAAEPAAGFSNSVLIGPTTWLPWLGDVFALPQGIPLANVFSIGDVLIGLGGFLFVLRTMRSGRDQAGSAEVSASPSS